MHTSIVDTAGEIGFSFPQCTNFASVLRQPLLARIEFPHAMQNFGKYYPLMLRNMRKWVAKRLTPYYLCPRSMVFWFFVQPFNAIGVTFLGLRTVVIYWRVQIEPNETIYLMFKLFELKTPVPLTLLTMFSALGLVIVDGIHRALETAQMECKQKVEDFKQSLDDLSASPIDVEQTIEQSAAEEQRQRLLTALSPFSLTPKLSMYFPILDNHVSVGFLTIDFRHIEMSVKQSLEPNETVLSLIRFLDLYTPFPTQIAAMLLSIGLFLSGIIHQLAEETREEVITELKHVLDTR